MRKTLLMCIAMLSSILSQAQLGPVMNICLVTVDSNSTHNIVVWEKASQISNVPIDSVKIYRMAVLGNDTLVGVVPWDSLSVFHDYSANPNLRSHRYRISGVDTLGIEGPMSVPHQTIHFSVLDNGSGNLHLVWIRYIGESINYYNCWSDSAGSSPGWQWVNSTANSTDSSWWDNATPSDWTNLTYLVDVNWNNQCTATKAQDHNSTRSNRSTITPGSLDAIFENLNSIEEFAVYPNPIEDKCTIVFSSTDWEPKRIDVVDPFGKVVKSYPSLRVIGQYQRDLDLSNLPAGIYQVVVSSATESVNLPLVKL